MRLSSSILLVLVSVGGVLAPSTAPARALDYRAPAGCPSSADVAARIDADAPDGRAARIDIHPVKRGYRGELIVGEGEHQLARSIEARTCGAVVEALTLVVALDGSAEAAPTAAAAVTEPASASVPPAAAAAERATTPAAPVRPRSRVEIGFGIARSMTSFNSRNISSGWTPSLQIGAPSGVFGAWWLRPFARASLLYTGLMLSSGTQRGLGHELDLIGGGFDGCLAAPLGGDWLRLSACSRTEVGSLAASIDGTSASSKSRSWMTTGSVGRARVVVLRRGEMRVVLEATGGVLAPVIRDRFHFEGNDTIVASRVLWTAGLGAGLELR
ncbi:MAG: hypothetical protein KF850_41670 [Labilithrix sp.]|nr:hypothetical protein [Labilithrix sp.]MBX3218589.1 hypothetical protein [Labilithrix sp.]